MKKDFFVLSLMAWMSFSVVAQASHAIAPTGAAAGDQNRSCYNTCCKLKTCAPKPISKPTTITKSGCYCLTDDICGQITIAADNVTLDLNCHEVNGNGADAAIKSDGHYNVVVKNGTVSNFLVVKKRGVGIAPNRCGVAISNGTDIELHDLNVISTDPVGMTLLNCIGLNISGCDFSNNVQALLLSGCRNGKVSCCQAYDNVNANDELEFTAIVGLDFCDCIEVVDVDVCNNIKNAFGLIEKNGILSVFFSSNVSLKRCKVNSNSTDLPLIGALLPIVMGFSDNCTVTDCQTNNNSIQDGTFVGIDIVVGPGCTIRNCQANGNTFSNNPFGIGAGIQIIDSEGCLIEGCQANNNTGGLIALRAIFIFLSESGVVRDCQMNGNSSSLVSAFGCFNSNDLQIADCQMNNNTATGSSGGMVVLGVDNVDIIRCQINNTVSTQGEAVGIVASDGIGLTVQDCEINNTIADGLTGGIVVIPVLPPDGTPTFPGQRDVRIVNCVVHGTTSTNFIAAGIALDGRQGILSPAPGTQNVAIKCCQIFDTVSSSPFLGTFAGGIVAQFTNDISIQDCQVYDTRGNNSTVAIGIGTITSVLRCNIEGCVANNTTAPGGAIGIGFLGVFGGGSSNCTVKDCSAIGNLLGFADFSGLNNFFAGNYAENNAVADYAGVTATPVMFTKSTGVFGATPNRWSNIQAVP